MRKFTAAALAAIAITATTTAASAQALCVVPLMISAAIVGAQEHRELTYKEAFFCGLIRDEDAQKKVEATTGAKAKKKTAR